MESTKRMTDNFPTLGPIIVGTTNIVMLLPFYEKVFGLTVDNQGDNYLMGKLTDGTIMELEEHSEQRFPNWKEHNVGTYKNSEFKVKDIHLFLETVAAHGGKVISQAKQRPWGSWGAEIADPEGNIFLITS